MRPEKVRILPYYASGLQGFDIEICDESATIEDYCRALDEYITLGELDRLRSDASCCEGCSACCGERMPLTSIDCLQIKRELAPELPWCEFLKRYAYVSVCQRVVDITLSRDADDKCILLNKDTGRCLHYRVRPLVCRTYICTISSPRANKLRQVIINTGEDELVRLWLACQQVVHEAEEPDVKDEDWKENSWTGKDMLNQITLRSIVSNDLWELIRKKGEEIV